MIHKKNHSVFSHFCLFFLLLFFIQLKKKTDFTIYQRFQSHRTNCLIGRCGTRFGIAMYPAFDIAGSGDSDSSVSILQHISADTQTITVGHVQTIATALHRTMYEDQ